MLNQVSLIGNIGTNIELKHSEAGVPYTKVNIAVNHHWTDDKGEKRKDTSWIRCMFWSHTAAIVSEYCRKGDKIAVGGRLHQNKWEHEGKKHEEFLVIVENLELLGRHGNGSSEIVDEDNIPF
jgi:single-strand DNA-binding protein